MRSASTRRPRSLRSLPASRPALAVQHRRPLFLGVVVRSHRPQGDLLLLLLLAIALYAAAPTFADMSSKLLLLAPSHHPVDVCGGFATVPAYLADMFGTQFVGAIHGRLLTAWSTAGIIGPVVVNYIREAQLAAGVPRDQLYNTTMYILCAMFDRRLICNYLIKPVDPKWHMSAEEVAKLQAATAKARPRRHRVRSASGSAVWTREPRCSGPLSVSAGMGVWITLQSAAKIF